MAKRRQMYAVYRGEEKLGDGTADELIEKLRINKKHFYRLATEGGNANKTKRLVVIKLDKEEL